MQNTNLSAIFAALSASMLILGASVLHAAPQPSGNRTELTQGVSAVYAPGALVGDLTIFDNTRAFTVLSGIEGKGRAPILAAANAGQGRVVVYAHNGFVSGAALTEAGTARLLSNAVHWTARKTLSPRVGLLGEGGAADALRAAGCTVTALTGNDLSELNSVDVLLLDPGLLESDAKIAAVQAWVRHGGGLVTSGVGWGWQQLNPTRPLSEASFNRLLISLAGIGVGSGTTDSTGPESGFLTDGIGLGSGDAEAALEMLTKASADQTTPTKPQIEEMTRTLSAATEEVPDTDTTFLPRLKTVLAKNGMGPAGDIVPTKAAPIGLDKPALRIAAVLEARRIARLPADQVRANPAAASFPGAVSANAQRLKDQTVLVDTAVPEWHSTGLYAAPGEIVTVTIPNSASSKGLGVRIGSHTDELWKVDPWWRFPKITNEQKIAGTKLRTANPFGGTIYITVPDYPASFAGDAGAKRGTVPVTISGGVAQPYFIKGKTSLADWKMRLRSSPAPWAELQGDRIILSLPSSAVRDLDDPEALMTYWDQVADAAADLYDIPRQRKRQERYCVDVQISAGYMHSGYPIMTFDDVAQTFTNLAILRGTNGLKTWGFYHELGHNHQQADWTWDGMGEVTNNLLSLYGDETFNGVQPDYENSHPAISPKARHDRLLNYLAAGPTPDGETANPWLALTMFIDLRQAFGWQPFKTVFGEYRALAPSQHPTSETDKHDQFMVRFSEVIGKNLGPYFTAWGLTTSAAARQSIASLPAWMPADWPTVQDITAVKADPKKINNFGY